MILFHENLIGFATVIDKDLSNRMTSTIRHNRARGMHNVELMSNIVGELTAQACRTNG